MSLYLCSVILIPKICKLKHIFGLHVTKVIKQISESYLKRSPKTPPKLLSSSFCVVKQIMFIEKGTGFHWKQGLFGIVFSLETRPVCNGFQNLWKGSSQPSEFQGNSFPKKRMIYRFIQFTSINLLLIHASHRHIAGPIAERSKSSDLVTNLFWEKLFKN